MSLNTKISAVVIFMASLLVHAAFAKGYSCGARCSTDKDCYKGGIVECGKCNLYRGTEGYKTCYNDEPPPPAPAPAPTQHDYFPNGGSCSNRCKNDRDCQQKGGFNPCGKCGKYAGTQMYQRCYQPDVPTPPTPTPTPAPPHDYFPKGGSCSNKCKTDRDCRNGGFNPCGKCGKYAGTQMYQRCYQPDDNNRGGGGGGGRHLVEDDDDDEEDSCGAICDSDSDCHQGGFVACGRCNLYPGTLGYQTCYNDNEPTEEPAPTPAPSSSSSTQHGFFPIGGSCRKECVSNADCRHGADGGFSPCGICGQVQGTEMYHACYQRPRDEAGRSLLRGSM
jgi:hypothetical protein